MYEDIYSKGNLPKELRSATVIPILKPGKNPIIRRKLPTNISGSCMCKVLEWIENKRLVYTLEERNGTASEKIDPALTF
jgi:hypothetical protein